MKLKEQSILFVTRTMNLGGTENVVLQLCEIFNPLVNKIVVCSCGGVNLEKLSNMRIRHYEIPDIESKSPLTMLAVIKAVLKIVKLEKITVIHTHHRMAAFYVSLLRLHKKCAYLNTSHNTFVNRKMLTQFAYKHAELIACGKMVKRNLVDDLGLPDKQITVVHNAVKPFLNAIIPDPLIEKQHKEGCFIVGNVGRLSEQKGMEYYIQAVPMVLEIHPNARFYIIGFGEDEQKLRRMVSDLGLEKYIFFMGYCNNVQNIMSQIDLVVLSSLWEGLPLTPIEAFSVGKTIIATAVDGTVEIVENHKSGILIEPRNAKQIAEKINWIIENPVERKKMEEAALERYLVEFSFKKFAAEYISCYERI